MTIVLVFTVCIIFKVAVVLRKNARLTGLMKGDPLLYFLLHRQVPFSAPPASFKPNLEKSPSCVKRWFSLEKSNQV